MSRYRLPRRLRAALAFALVALLTAPAALAQEDSQHSADSRTVVHGRANGRAIETCSASAASGDASDAAIEACTAALRSALGPDRISLLSNRGILYVRRQQGALALADLDAAQAIRPNNPEIQLNRGAILVQLHQPGPAIAALTEALGLGVGQPYKAYYNRGIARESLGDIRGALEDYNTALQIHPNWAPAEAEVARFVRGRQQRLAGMMGDQTNPSSPPAQN